MEDIQKWSVQNKLKFNEEKTVLLVLCTPHQRKRVSSSSITIGNTTVEAVEVVRNLRAKCDQHMLMDANVSHVCQTAFNQLRPISRISNVLSLETAETLIHALVFSRLDNGNVLLSNAPTEQITKL